MEDDKDLFESIVKFELSSSSEFIERRKICLRVLLNLNYLHPRPEIVGVLTV